MRITLQTRTRDGVYSPAEYAGNGRLKKVPGVSYYIRHTDESGKQVRRNVGKDPTLALIELKKMEAVALGGDIPVATPRRPARKTVKEAVAEYKTLVAKKHAAAIISKATVRGYTHVVGEFAETEGLPSFIDEVTDSHVLDYVAFIRAKETDPNAEQTVRKKLEWLRTFFLKYNVRAVTGEIMPKKRCSKKEPYTDRKVEAMLLACETPEETALVRVFADGGVRKMEAAHLEVSDLVVATSEIKIQDKLEKYKWKPKDGDARTFDVSTPCMKALMVVAARRGDGLLFPAPEGGVDGHIERTIKRIAGRAGVSLEDHKVNHSFRYYHACKCMLAGMDIKQLKDRMGHSDFKTLEIYLDKIRKLQSAEERRALLDKAAVA